MTKKRKEVASLKLLVMGDFHESNHVPRSRIDDFHETKKQLIEEINGLAKELLKACETWSKEQGCSEFASDCELENENSLKFHLKMGFEEVNRVICFMKRI